MAAASGSSAAAWWSPASSSRRPRSFERAISPWTQAPAARWSISTGAAPTRAFLPAGNLLRPVESAGWAYREGWAAGLAIAQDLRGLLPRPERHIPVRATEPIRFVTPGRIAVPDRPLGPLQLKVRMARPAVGRLHLLVDGRCHWTSRRMTALPERRIGVARALPELADVARLDLVFEERS